MPLVGEATERVDIGEDWYELKKEIGWYDEAQAKGQAGRVMLPVAAMDRGNIQESDLIELKLSPADASLSRLVTRIKGWSHPHKVSQTTIKRIPPSHARILLAKIQEFERRENELEAEIPKAS